MFDTKIIRYIFNVGCVFLNSYIKFYTKKVTFQTITHSFTKLFIRRILRALIFFV